MKCFLCGGRKFEIKYENKNYHIVSCSKDHLHFKIAKEKQVNLYNKNYFASYPYCNFLNLNDIYFKNKLKTIKRLTKKETPRVLDVGCGWGDFLEVLQKEKTSYLGIDENQEAIEICKKKKLNCMKAQNGIKLSDDNFDAITLFQTIEHLSNPLPLLRDCYKLLKPGGVLLITTPNNDSPLRKLSGHKWTVYNTNSHFVFYNKNSLRKTLKAAGFKKVEAKIDQPRFFSLGYILNRLNILNRKSKILNLISLPTDPFGDIEASALKN